MKENFRRVTDEDRQRIIDMTDGRIILIAKFVPEGISEPVRFQCTRCGAKKKFTWPDILNSKIYCNHCDEFLEVEELIDEVNPEIQLLYLNKEENRVRVKCLKCGGEIELVYKYFRNRLISGDFRCSICSMNENKKPLTIEDVEERIRNRHGDSISLVRETYKNTHEKATFKCNICGNEFSSYVKRVYEKTGCPYCAKNHTRITQESFERRFFENHSRNEYEIIGKIDEKTTVSDKIRIKHITCGTEYDVLILSAVKKNRCPHCYGPKKFDNDDFLFRLKQTHGDEYTPLEIYTKAGVKMRFRHNFCGKEFMADPSKVINGSGCPHCYAPRAKTYEEVKEIFEKYGEGEYELLSKEYKNNVQKLDIKHLKCGTIFQMNLMKFYSRNQRCPVCASSRQETRIRKYLIDSGIPFEREKKFEGCVCKKELPFDFFLNGRILLEYDGEFHYLPIVREEKVRKTKERDEIKNKFCEENKIPLFRIPFWEETKIEKILERLVELSKSDLSYKDFLLEFDRIKSNFNFKNFEEYKAEE